MERHPGAGLTISQLLYALEREIDDITNKRRLVDHTSNPTGADMDKRHLDHHRRT